MMHYVCLLLICCCLSLISGYRLPGYRPNRYQDNYRDYDSYRDYRNYNEKFVNDIAEHAIKDTQTKTNKREFEDAFTKLPKNGELFEEDIIMDDRLRASVLGVSKKSSVKTEGVLWPGGVLPYVLAPSFKNNKRAMRLFREALHEFNTRTCIKLVKRTNQTSYVIYNSSEDVCSSFIGCVGGPQMIHIGVDCLVLGTILHETMHALGFIHEHSRPDRDKFINVSWSNIDEEDLSNFNKYTMSEVDNNNVEYNFASVMHYRNDAFTNNGKDTLTSKEEPELQFGQRIKFSVGDVMEINNLYGCKGKHNYHGLFKDYTTAKDSSASEKRKKKLRDLLRKSFYEENHF